MHVLCFTSVGSACSCCLFILRDQCWARQRLAATSFHSFMSLHQGFHLKGLIRQSQAVMLYTRYIFTSRAWPGIDSRFIKHRATAVYQISKPKKPFSVLIFSVFVLLRFFFFSLLKCTHLQWIFLAGALCCIPRVCCHGNRRSTNGSRKSWRRSGKKHRGRWQRRRGSTTKRCVCAYAHKYNISRNILRRN